jgi:putative ABC transport system permease protein
MGTLWQDIRYGVRMLAKSPGFTVLVMGMLAVGIAANTALFSVVNAVMLRPLPYQDPDRLVTIWEEDARWDEGFEARPHFAFLRQNNEVFESLGGWCRCFYYVEGIDRPHEVDGCEVTTNLFSVLGVPPALGRGFLPEEERLENAHVAILGHEFWQEHLGGAPDVLGKNITLTVGTRTQRHGTLLQRESYTIVGIMPAGFGFPSARSMPLWTPLVLSVAARGEFPPLVFPVARLKKGVTLAQADANLGVLAGRLHEIAPQAKVEPGRVGVTRLLDDMVKGHRRLPLLLLGAAGFVLLIACANAANLFLARATVRQREMAMRTALGASRGRVLRQMLTESLLLSLGAGVLGLGLTYATVKGLVHLCPANVPRLQETSVDPAVLGFTLALSVLTGLLFGMMPAWRASDVHVGETLKEGSGRTTAGRGWRRLHSGLVVSQVGLSLILLIGAALLIRSLMTLAHVDLGCRPENVLAMQVRLPEAKYNGTAQFNAFFRPFLERLQALPHVRSAAAVFHSLEIADVLFPTDPFSLDYSVVGRPDSAPRHSARWMRVTPDYFAALGIRFLRGRPPAEEDQDAFVINETFARACFPDSDPLGQSLSHGGLGDRPHRIVGVVSTVRSFDTPEPEQGVIYSLGKDFMGFAVFVVRTEGDPTNWAAAVREQAAAVGKDAVIETLEPLTTTLSQMLAPRRFVMILLSLFAGIALALAAVGVYGLLQYSTTQQIHDIGIRLALGARQTDILRAVAGRGLKLTLVGVVLGLAGALALTRLLSSLLYGVAATDPLTLACMSAALAGIALLASYLPARRAARTDPMVALRYE